MVQYRGRNSTNPLGVGGRGCSEGHRLVGVYQGRRGGAGAILGVVQGVVLPPDVHTQPVQ